MGSQQWLAHLSPSWVVSKATSLSRHLAKQRFNTWHKWTTVWKTSWSLSHLHTHDDPTTSKTSYDDIKKASLAKEWNSFHLSWKELDDLHLKDFLNTNVNCTWSNHWHPPQRKINVAYRTSNHWLAIEIGRWSTISISRDIRLCHFCSYAAIEIEEHFVLECPLYNPIRDEFPSLFENVILESLKSFFHLDHQVDINLLSHRG